MIIADVIEMSLRAALAANVDGASAEETNTGRAAAWMAALTGTTADHYRDDPGVSVFTLSNSEHRKELHRNEYLHDLCACRMGTSTSTVHRVEIPCVTEVLWQFESELESDGRAQMIDFNKLALGSAAEKLFITSHGRDNRKTLDFLSPAVRCCTGTVFVAFIPHPNAWDRSALGFEVWRFDSTKEQWVEAVSKLVE